MNIGKVLTIALLCAVVCSLQTYADQYVLLGATQDVNHELYPTFNLGYINETAEVILQIKINPTLSTTPLTLFTPQISQTIAATPTDWTVPAVTTFLATSDASILEAKFTITTSGHYKARIIPGSGVSLATHLHIFTLSAFVKVGTTNAVVTPIFKDYVDILRIKPIKYIYIQSDNTAAKFNVSVKADQDAAVAGEIQYWKMDTTDTSNLKGVSTFASAGGATDTTITHIWNVTKTLSKGYHAIKDVIPQGAIRTSTLFVQSDPYPCPFPATSTDLHDTFPGCYHPANTSTGNGAVFPCIIAENGTCNRCYFGYALVGAACVYNPCNSDQYYSNSVCIKASSSCLTFNRFTGVCLSCVNSNYTLANGACNVNACPAGQTIRLNTCVSNYCNAFVVISGACSSCINNAFELINGTCAPVKCFAANLYFSFAVQACTVFPTYCSSINLITQKCTACLAPFTLNAGTSVCQLICVAPQVKWQDQCVNLPQNCNAINSIRQCSQCKINFALEAGICKPTGIIIINNP